MDERGVSMRFQGTWTAVLFFWLVVAGGVRGQEAQVDRQGSDAAPSATAWRSPAKLHKTFGKTKGEIVIGEEGIRFQAKEGPTSDWRFEDIQTFSLQPHSLVIETYKNRTHHMPGVQRFHFELTQNVPPEIAETGSGRPATIAERHSESRLAELNRDSRAPPHEDRRHEWDAPVPRRGNRLCYGFAGRQPQLALGRPGDSVCSFSLYVVRVRISRNLHV